MGSFGEDLRAERLSRGIALEDITEVTKICQRHLVALEENRFRLLPGGILSKGIVRGYAGAIGLDERDWTDRFVREHSGTGSEDDDRGWMEFASNVGKTRLERREAAEYRMRWVGAAVLMMVATAATFLALRYYGVQAGWWSSMLPLHETTVHAQAVVARTVSTVKH